MLQTFNHTYHQSSYDSTDSHSWLNSQVHAQLQQAVGVEKQSKAQLANSMRQLRRDKDQLLADAAGRERMYTNENKELKKVLLLASSMLLKSWFTGRNGSASAHALLHVGSFASSKLAPVHNIKHQLPMSKGGVIILVYIKLNHRHRYLMYAL